MRPYPILKETGLAGRIIDGRAPSFFFQNFDGQLNLSIYLCCAVEGYPICHRLMNNSSVRQSLSCKTRIQVHVVLSECPKFRRRHPQSIALVILDLDLQWLIRDTIRCAFQQLEEDASRMAVSIRPR